MSDLRSRLSYANVMSSLAAFGVLATGGAYAAGQIGSGDIEKNAIKSKHVKDGQIMAADLASDSVSSDKVAPDSLTGVDINEAGLDSAIVQRRVAGNCAVGESIRAIAADGAVTCEPDDAGGPPSGPAGGDLTGSYPNPTIPANSLDGTEINEAGLDETVLQRRIGPGCPANQAIRDVTQTGSVVCESAMAQATKASIAGTVAEVDKSGATSSPAGPPGGYFEVISRTALVTGNPYLALAKAQVDNDAATPQTVTCRVTGPTAETDQVDVELAPDGGTGDVGEVTLMVVTAPVSGAPNFILSCTNPTGIAAAVKISRAKLILYPLSLSSLISN